MRTKLLTSTLEVGPTGLEPMTSTVQRLLPHLKGGPYRARTDDIHGVKASDRSSLAFSRVARVPRVPRIALQIEYGVHRGCTSPKHVLADRYHPWT
jgi:hypothetical protein